MRPMVITAESALSSKTRWTIVGLLSASIAINLLDRQIFSVLAPLLRETFTWSNTQYGYAAVAFNLGMMLGQVPAGALMDRVGTKNGLLVIFLGWSLLTAAHALAGPGTAIDSLGSLFALPFVAIVASLTFTTAPVLAAGLSGFIFLRFLLGLFQCGQHIGKTRHDPQPHVIAAGLQMRIPEKGIILALATAMQESGMRNLANPNVPESLRIPNEGVGRDHQSVGIFQQQPWWGTIRDLMTPRIAALKFYAGLLKVGGWQQMAPTVAAQSVQQSEFPDAYADDVAAATLFYRQHLREVLTAAGPGASTPDSMDSDETENLCAASRPRASRSVYNLSKLPPGKAPEDRLQRYTILTNRAVSAAFPQVKTIGGYRPDSMKWHPQGLALDIMVSSAYPPLSPQGIALGNGIRDFLLKNAKTLGVELEVHPALKGLEEEVGR